MKRQLLYIYGEILAVYTRALAFIFYSVVKGEWISYRTVLSTNAYLVEIDKDASIIIEERSRRIFRRKFYRANASMHKRLEAAEKRVQIGWGIKARGSTTDRFGQLYFPYQSCFLFSSFSFLRVRCARHPSFEKYPVAYAPTGITWPARPVQVCVEYQVLNSL